MILEDTSTVIYLDGGQGEGLDAEVEALQLLHDAVLRPGLGVAELHDCAGDGGRVLGEGGAAAVRILRPAPTPAVKLEPKNDIKNIESMIQGLNGSAEGRFSLSHDVK